MSIVLYNREDVSYNKGMKTTWTVETMERGEWIQKVAPTQTKPHLTYSSRTAAEMALPFLPQGRRYRLSDLGLPVTVH